MKMDMGPEVYIDLTGIHAIGRSYKWDDRFIDLAQHVAQWSKDPSTKVGAVLVDKDRRVVSLGYNGAPRGTEEPDGSNREQKLMRTIHAEENALHFAERDVAGCTMYVSRPPCARCAAHMIQRGVSAVVYSYDGYDFDEYMSRWKESFDEAMKMFREAGVAVFAHKKIDTSGQVDAATFGLASYEKMLDEEKEAVHEAVGRAIVHHVTFNDGESMRQVITELAEANDCEVVFIDGHDSALLGTIETESTDNYMRTAYSTARITLNLMDEGMSLDEAIEYLEFNILGAYVGKATPMFVDDTHTLY